MSRLRHLLVAGACAALASAVLAPAASAGTSATPTPKAKKAGITRDGLAYLGWEKHSTPPEQSPEPTAAPTAPSVVAANPEGIDVSSHQGNVDWASWWAAGKQFAYVKATEGTSYTNPYFAQQYNGSYTVGMIRGAYHFARPDVSSGATQANYLVDHGGGWSRDGKTLPAALDIEYNPYGATCYGLSQASMRSWISSFVTQFKARTGRDAVIYSTTDWWTTCTGNTSQFSSTNPLWIARYSSTVGTLPAGWLYQTFWQYSSTPIDQDRFNGSYTGLQNLANG